MKQYLIVYLLNDKFHTFTCDAYSITEALGWFSQQILDSDGIHSIQIIKSY